MLSGHCRSEFPQELHNSFMQRRDSYPHLDMRWSWRLQDRGTAELRALPVRHDRVLEDLYISIRLRRNYQLLRYRNRKMRGEEGERIAGISRH